jgi:hypothetical protein
MSNKSTASGLTLFVERKGKIDAAIFFLFFPLYEEVIFFIFITLYLFRQKIPVHLSILFLGLFFCYNSYQLVFMVFR